MIMKSIKKKDDDKKNEDSTNNENGNKDDYKPSEKIELKIPEIQDMKSDLGIIKEIEFGNNSNENIEMIPDNNSKDDDQMPRLPSRPFHASPDDIIQRDVRIDDKQSETESNPDNLVHTCGDN